MNNFYVYIHRAQSPRDKGELFYIGKGRGRRAWSKTNRNCHWKAIVAKHGYVVQIVADGLTEGQAFDLEKSLISISGREVLCNLTDGGDGPSGMKHSEATKNQMSARLMGNAYNKWQGKKHSETTKAKMSEAQKGNTHWQGKKHSEATKAKMSAAGLGKLKSQATKDKLSAARKGKTSWNKGKPHSEATKSKIREAALRRSQPYLTLN